MAVKKYLSLDRLQEYHELLTQEIATGLSSKSDSSHNHDSAYDKKGASEAALSSAKSYTDQEVAKKADGSHNHDSAYDYKGSAAQALTDSKEYTDQQIDAIVGEGAATTLDTIGEISAALKGNAGIIDTLATKTSLDSHTADTTAHITSTERTSWNGAVTKLSGIAEGANKTVVDTAMSATSTNPVQNKTISSAISTVVDTVSLNTSSINSHSTAISNLQTAVEEIQTISSDDIRALFA